MRREQENALYVLDRLRILTVSQSFSTGASCYVTSPFSPSLRHALTGTGKHKSFGVHATREKGQKIGLEDIGTFATSQWEALLYYIVGSSNKINVSQAELSEGAKTLLKSAEFVKGTGRVVEITAKGFDFLLQEINAQVWSLLVEYISLAEQSLDMSKVKVLSFLFTVGSLEIGQDYSKRHHSETEQMVLEDLHNFGLVYMPPNSDCYYPTPIASCITSDSSFGGSSAAQTGMASRLTGSLTPGQSGFIVIETNYRIYAYTNSQLQIEILSLFTRLVTRYPNMVAGRITRDSIQGAIAKGITSQQIISYLTSHAHGVMNVEKEDAATGYKAPSRPQIPPTVVDQIRLWQIEGDRMQTTPGYLFRDFFDRKEFEEAARYADEVGVLVWRNDQKQFFFATRVEQLSKFIANRSEKRRNEAANGA